ALTNSMPNWQQHWAAVTTTAKRHNRPRAFTMTTPNSAASRRKPLLILATFIFLVIGAAYAIWWFIYVSGYESTEDAYVHGNLVQVTSQIPGTVISIAADNTQTVSKGGLLVELDDSDTGIALK